MTTKSDSGSASKPRKRQLGVNAVMDIFDIGRGVAIIVSISLAVVFVLATYYFITSAPPSTLTMTSGAEGSSYYKIALKYQKILASNGVKLKILTSEGSLENLKRLSEAHPTADIGFVQAGTKMDDPGNLVSLASVSYQPLMVFYRGKEQDLLSGFTGKKIAVGPIGSGLRNIAIALLAENGIKEGGPTPLMDLEADKAAKELLAQQIDVAFFMSENASTDVLRELLRSKEVKLFDFKQAHAYSRKIDNLNLLEMPRGSVDFGLDIPAHDVNLLGPMVELIATKKLHPALSDLLLEAAVQIHSHPSTYQKRGEFPTPIEHNIPVSEDAERFFKSGKSLLYRYLPFWLASLTSRVIVVVLPILVLLIPALRSIPAIFRWRVQRKIHRRYRELLRLEQDAVASKNNDVIDGLQKEFDKIEEGVNKMKIPPRFADQYYALRGHITYVRDILAHQRRV